MPVYLYHTLQDMATEFVNGTLGHVQEVVLDEEDATIVKAILFKPEGSNHTLTITKEWLCTGTRKTPSRRLRDHPVQRPGPPVAEYKIAALQNRRETVSLWWD